MTSCPLAPRKPARQLAGAVLAIGLLALAPTARSAEAVSSGQPYGERSPLFNWYFASAFGSGFYKVGDTKVLSIRLPFSLGGAADERDSLSLRVVAPTTVSFASRHGDASQDVPDALGSLSANLGLELDWLPSRDVNWHIRPFFTVGAAREFVQDISATLYTIGLRTRHQRAVGHSEVGVGASVIAANISSAGTQEKLGELALGLDWKTRVWSDSREPMRLGFQFVQYWYFNRLNFLTANSDDYQVDRVSEVGIYVMPEQPWRLLGFDMDRIGLAYRQGTNLHGVVLLTTFPF